MATYVAFLRAINLGARRQFPKQAIVDVTTAAGFTGVATHINTGNVRLETRMRSRSRIEAALEAAYAADRGFGVPVVLLTTEELRTVAREAEALPHPDPDGARYVALLKHSPDPAAALVLEARSEGGERAVVRERAVHLLAGAEYHRSRFGNDVIERHLGVATSRNLTVVRALVEKWC